MRAREARGEVGISVAALAKQIGVAQSTLNEFFNGERKGTPSFICRLARALDVNCDWLEEGIGPRRRAPSPGFSRAKLEACIAHMEEIILGHDRQVPPNKKASIVLLLLDQLPDEDEAQENFDPAKYRRLLELI
ncbi:MAG: helix-turn-helix domain-containing protein [Phycisphaerales bacterium JB039]